MCWCVKAESIGREGAVCDGSVVHREHSHSYCKGHLNHFTTGFIVSTTLLKSYDRLASALFHTTLLNTARVYKMMIVSSPLKLVQHSTRIRSTQNSGGTNAHQPSESSGSSSTCNFRGDAFECKQVQTLSHLSQTI